MFPDASQAEAKLAIKGARAMLAQEQRWSEEITAVLGPYWSQHPELTMEQVIFAVAAQGEPKAIAMRDQLVKGARA